MRLTACWLNQTANEPDHRQSNLGETLARRRLGGLHSDERKLKGQNDCPRIINDLR